MRYFLTGQRSEEPSFCSDSSQLEVPYNQLPDKMMPILGFFNPFPEGFSMLFRTFPFRVLTLSISILVATLKSTTLSLLRNTYRHLVALYGSYTLITY